MISLSNQYVTATIATKGAELSSVRSSDNYEFIWQAGAAWPRHSPILFPIEGRLRNDQYQHAGKTYQLTQHGFARDLDFRILEHSGQTARFQLTDSALTLDKYPFRFALEIGYQLRDRQLLVSYAVTNHDTQIMFFSIGAHPAFNTPGNFEDWFIEFDQAETVDRHYLAGGVFSGETAPVLNDQTVLHLNDGLFERDAIVLKTLRSKTVRLRSTASTRQITLDFGGFPYLGIWTKTAAPFVCLEPWYGLADSANSDGQLAHKEGIQNLAPGQTFNSLYTLAFE